jgi:hypothetical protein
MKNGILTINLFPNSGHHFYFVPLAIGQGQGTPAAQNYSREIDLPNLSPPQFGSLSTLCTGGADWMPAVNRLPNLTPDRRPILILLNDGFGR